MDSGAPSGGGSIAPVAPNTALSPNRVRDSLGAEAVEIMERTAGLEVATLRLVAASEARSTALQSKDRIVGYPMRGLPRSVGRPESEVVVKMLLAPESYAWGALRRCLNSRLVGMRFASGERIVEVALGMNCRQVFWAFPAEGKRGHWGAVLSEATARGILALLDPFLLRERR